MKIKNLLLAVLLIVLSLPVVQAQFGVRLGANLANQTIESGGESLDTKMKFGFGAGVFYQYMVNDNFTIQPELNFMQMGTKFDLDFLGTTIESTTTFNYLQIPILAKYGFGDMDALNFYVQAGPYVALGLGKVKTKSCVGDDCETEDTDYGDGEDGPKSLDFGLQLGAGVNITKNISVDARYGLGLANLTSEEDSTYKNSSIFISLGYKF
ncbi:MAG: PorT family protein [Saprospiraceae bacterium]|nr:PorT family protein [Saprospiraceae bacterium]